MLAWSKTKVGSALNQISIEAVRAGIVKIDALNYFKVWQVSSLNFELKSEVEQDNIIDIYQSFINAINFPLQVLIRIREIDIIDYLTDIESRVKKEDNETYKQLLVDYQDFLKSLVRDNKILSKYFYVVLPLHLSKKMDFDYVMSQLNLRSDIVQRNLKRLNISVKELDSVDTINLFYNFYNPSRAKTQPLVPEVLNFSHNI